MKVLWFSNTPALGFDFINQNSQLKGTGGWMYSLNRIVQDRVDLTVAFHYPYFIKPFVYQSTMFYPIYNGNILIENIKSRFLANVYDDDFLSQYLQIVNLVKPDIIHIHGTENSFLCLINHTKVPVIVSIQGNLTVYFHKFNSGFHRRFLKFINYKSLNKSSLLGKSSFNQSYIRMKKMSKIEQKYLKYTKYVIGRTDWDRRITSILAPESNYFVGNELLRDVFYKEIWKNNFIADKLILFTTNGNNYYKGFETLCYSLYLLNRYGINVEWRVAGISTDSLINIITKKHLKGCYPQKSLVLLGSLDEHQLAFNLIESNIYVMPSHIENSPNNLCEAMMLGMPCIATFAGGTGSMLKDGEEGILVQDGDPWVMSGAILELFNNPIRAFEMGQRARLRALQRHDKEEIVNNLILIYQQVLNENCPNNRT